MNFHCIRPLPSARQFSAAKRPVIKHGAELCTVNVFAQRPRGLHARGWGIIALMCALCASGFSQPQASAVPNAGSFDTKYPGLSRIEITTGDAAGSQIDFEPTIPQDQSSGIQTALGLATTFYKAQGLGDPGTTHIFAFANIDALANFYSQWFHTPLDSSKTFWASTTAITSRGVIFISTQSPHWKTSGSDMHAQTVSHELFHVLQYRLANNLVAPAWLVEGSAQYMGFRVLDANQIFSFDRQRGRTISAVPVSAVTLRSLEHASARENVAVYTLGFLGVDLLVKSSGLPSIAAFFANIGQGQTWQTAFQKAFGQTAATFYKQFEAVRADFFGAPQIKGIVTNIDGEPYPNISIYACSETSHACSYALTDSSGAYRVPVQNGGYRIHFGRVADVSRPDGFYSTTGSLTGFNEASVVRVNGSVVSGIGVQMPF